jgi:putative FmdB family regulatory protein
LSAHLEECDMPIYEYRCKKCEKRFELMRRLAERDKQAKCSNCGSRATTRILMQPFATVSNASPDIMSGEGEPEDFMGGDDFGGLGMDDDFDF